MPDSILIVDDVVTNRIVLKVKLSSAGYSVQVADNLADARQVLAERRHVLMLVSDRLVGPDELHDLCAELAADRDSPPLLVVGTIPGQEDEHLARLQALTAGAQDYLALPVDEGTLLARVRSLVRHCQPPSALDLSWPATTGPVGLAEAAGPALLTPDTVALVSPSMAEAMGWRRQLAGLMPQILLPLRPTEVFEALRDGRRLDAIVISASHGRLSDLRLLAELKARHETSGIPVVVLGGEEGEFGIMALDLGAQDVLPRRFDPEELALRLRLRLGQRHEAALRQRELSEQLRLASTDALTGVANRRATLDRQSRLHLEFRRGGPGYALMMMDIDRFKAVNDNWGHAAGDAVLAGVAARLAAGMRERDIFGRIGGEEFLVALPATPLAEACRIAERLRQEVGGSPLRVPGVGAVRVTLSIGLCTPDGTESAASVIDRADKALYAAKAHGRNMVEVARSAA